MMNKTTIVMAALIVAVLTLFIVQHQFLILYEQHLQAEQSYKNKLTQLEFLVQQLRNQTGLAGCKVYDIGALTPAIVSSHYVLVMLDVSGNFVPLVCTKS